MLLFRGLLIVMLANIIIYTGVVGMDHGWNLVPIFFADIAAMNWQGQFNVDFSSFLILSALWTMWRNRFSALGIVLGLIAAFGGMLFLSVYLLVLSFQTGGDINQIILGQQHDKPAV